MANNLLLQNQKSPMPVIKHLIKLIKIDGWHANNLFFDFQRRDEEGNP